MAIDTLTRAKYAGLGNRSHGEAYKTAEYRAWMSIKSRAKHSGGQISVCERWLSSYETFLTDMGRKPGPDFSIDRKNPSGSYEPSNCRWATKVEQARNVCSNRLVTFEGQTKCVTEWAQLYGISPTTLHARLFRYEWPTDKALAKKATYKKNAFRASTHGKSKTSEYKIWKQMRYRCADPDNQNYAEYGARGIKVCERWGSFPAFLEDVGPRPSPKHSLDRINPNGNYEHGNCRWADSKTQQRNRRDTRWLTFNGETKCLQEWADLYKIGRTALSQRLKLGWTIERALTQKVKE